MKSVREKPYSRSYSMSLVSKKITDAAGTGPVLLMDYSAVNYLLTQLRASSSVNSIIPTRLPPGPLLVL